MTMGDKMDMLREESKREGIAIGEKRGQKIGQKRGIAIGEKRGFAMGEEQALFALYRKGVIDVSVIEEELKLTEAEILKKIASRKD